MKKFYYLISLVCTATIIEAQNLGIKDLQAVKVEKMQSTDSNGWKKSGTLIFNLNQGALSHWVAGGEENTFGVNSIFNYVTNYKNGKNNWDNFIDLAFGFQNATSFTRLRKIDDRIDITSKYGYQLSSKWNAGILFNFNSQALPGYDYTTTPETKISNFLTPGKILLSPGMDFKPGTRFSLFISPITIRWVLKRDEDFFHVSKFGVDSARRVNTELGAFVMAKYIAAFTHWASYTGRLDLFSNYRRNPQNIDILMNNLLTMKFTKILSANLSLDLIYDDDIIKRVQLKEILGIGLTLNL